MHSYSFDLPLNQDMNISMNIIYVTMYVRMYAMCMYTYCKYMLHTYIHTYMHVVMQYAAMMLMCMLWSDCDTLINTSHHQIHLLSSIHSHPPLETMGAEVRIPFYPPKDVPQELNVKALVGYPMR